ncbi:MAG: hypothetical protein M1830_001174, partial [Pleopsidium flavum]
AVESFRTNSEKPKSRKPSSQSSIDIVAGGVKGGIYIYRDLLERLIQKERLAQTGRALDLSASLHHWHREAVSTVKWSLDGNYIISGGAETVLVLWQLDTSKKQFLPHLSSAIESLVVSAGGSSYALRLADNSAMVLSTSELKPTASIAGIQCRSRTRSRVPQPLPKTVDSSIAGKLEHAYSRLLRIPSAVNPLYPSQLLLAVSASQPIHSESVATNRVSFLQTFDFATTQHISRQALARTNTTALNIGPDGGKIGEPDVKYMRVSHDGQWLATVDEWRLPSKDLDFLSVDERAREEEQQKRQEVFLKFWSWNPEAKEWQLVTRVDSPHASTSVDGPGAGEVLTLATDPSALGFASLGEDGVVRVWRPKIRRRNGIEVRGKNAEGLISWHQHVIQLGNTSQQMKLAGASPRASIAWSEDGSLLAVSQQCSSADGHGVVHFIDAASGRIRQSRAGMYAGDLITMGIVDRYLIILSDQLSVWDMVDDELHFGLSLQSHRFSSQERAAATHLTVDQRHHTFALALPVTGNEKHKTGSEPGKRSQSQIAIFDPSEPTPLYTTLVPHMVTSLLPVSGSRGYIVLDSAAEVRILSPKSVPFVSNTAFAAGSTDSSVGLENVYGRGKTNADILKNDGNDLSDDESDVVTPQFASAEARPEIYDDEDAPVVSQQQLAGIFDVGSPFAMPPIDELFERVARLFAKKPRPLS